MGKINRFYSPVQQQYVSQFIPENLQLMQNALNVKQNQYDTTQKQLDLYEDELLKQQALQGYDTEVLKSIRSDYDKFNADLLGKDLGDPKVAREVGKFIRDYKRDPRVTSLNEGLALKQKHDEIIEKLKTSGKYATENDLAYIKAWENYINQTGEDRKFASEFLRGTELVAPDAPSRPELEKLVDNVKSNSIKYDKVRGEWIDKVSNEVVTRDRLEGIMLQNMQPFLNTQAGKQMQNRASEMGIPVEQLFMQEANPVIEERVYSKKGRQLGTNFNYWKQQKAATEQAYSLVQSGKTQGLFASFDNMPDFEKEMKRLKTSTNPEDNRKAAQMEAQKDLLNEKFSKQLTANEAAVINVKAERILKDENNLNQLLSKHWMEPIGRAALAKFGLGDGRIESVSKLTMDQKKQVFNEIKNWQDINGSSDDTNLEKNVQRQYAKLLGVDYDNLDKKRNEYISKGEIFEAKDIILNSSKGSTSARNYFGDQAKTAINDVNWDIIGSTTEENIPLEQAMQTLDKQSIKLIDGVNGPELYFKYKDADGEFQNMTIQSKDIGKDIQETTLSTYNTLSGGDRQLFNRLVESHVYSNIQPIGNNSTYNQKEDVKVALGNILNGTINNYSDEDKAEYYNGTIAAMKELDNYNDVKIVRVGDKVTIKADGKTLVEPQETVADVMDELRDTSK